MPPVTGPKDVLGDKLIVENKNVGIHMTGDFDMPVSAYFEDAIYPEGEVRGPSPWAATTPRPWGEMTVQIRAGGDPREPVGSALSPFAPSFGWEHKEFVRNGFGPRHVMSWRCHFGAVPWTWRVMPQDGRIERVDLDAPRVDAAMKQAAEIVRAWIAKLPVKALKTDFRALNRPSTTAEPQHRVGTARAGSSPENSVCTSDFDCHDIDSLLFTSSATIPRTFFWSLGPTATNAAYGYRRMIANHFSTGCSTKGFA